MKQRNLIYIAISIICVIAVIVGIVYQVSKSSDKSTPQPQKEENKIEEETIDLEAAKNEFYDLFDNKFNNQGYTIDEVKKIYGFEHEDYIYAAYTVKQEVEGKYKVNLNLPVFNIDGDEAAKINATTQEIFANKASSVLTSSTKYTIYNTDFTAYLNGNILSLVIRSNLKEGDDPQRLIVQTYNYDLENKKRISLNEVLAKYDISKKTVNEKIDKWVKEANKQAVAISEALGQTIFKRDLNNAMYVTDNVSNFFIGEDDQIYIVYPYGNSNLTSEIDIIKL